MKDKTRYRIELVDAGADTPTIVRLRAMLKNMLRTYALRATGVIEIVNHEQTEELVIGYNESPVAPPAAADVPAAGQP